MGYVEEVYWEDVMYVIQNTYSCGSYMNRGENGELFDCIVKIKSRQC